MFIPRAVRGRPPTQVDPIVEGAFEASGWVSVAPSGDTVVFRRSHGRTSVHLLITAPGESRIEVELPSEIRVLLADGSGLVRSGIRLVLESSPDIHVIADLADGSDALDRIEQDRPDVAILEAMLPSLSGFDVIERLGRTSPTRCIVLSSDDSRRCIQETLRVGAAGFAHKAAPAEQLIEAVHSVRDGRYYFPPEVAEHLVEAAIHPERDFSTELAGLTTRERQVMQMIAEGQTTREIAALLGISVRTADSHRSHLMSKLNVRKVSGLIRMAIREGLINA